MRTATYGRQIEWLCAVGAGGAGLLALAFVVAIADHTVRALPWLIAIALVILAAPVGAYLHGRAGYPEGRLLQWMSAVLLLGFAVAAVASFGILLLPAAVLATIAAIAGR